MCRSTTYTPTPGPRRLPRPCRNRPAGGVPDAEPGRAVRLRVLHPWAARGGAGGRAVRPCGRVRGTAAHELHRARLVTLDLRWGRARLRAAPQLLPRGERVGGALGPADQ